MQTFEKYTLDNSAEWQPQNLDKAKIIELKIQKKPTALKF